MSASFSKSKLIVNAAADIREYYIFSFRSKFCGADRISLYYNRIIRWIRDASSGRNKDTALGGREFSDFAVVTICPDFGYNLIGAERCTEYNRNIGRSEYCRGSARISKLKMQRKRCISVREENQWARDRRFSIVGNPWSLRSSKVLSHYIKLALHRMLLPQEDPAAASATVIPATFTQTPATSSQKRRRSRVATRLSSVLRCWA